VTLAIGASPILTAQGLSQYLLLGRLLGLRRLLLFLATFFRGALGSRTLLLGCLREHALGRGWLVIVLLLLEHLLLLLLLEDTLALWGLLLLGCRTLSLWGLLLEHLLLLLEDALALWGLLLLGCHTLPLWGLLLEHLLLLLLLGLLWLTFLTVPAGFFLQSTPLGLALYT